MMGKARELADKAGQELWAVVLGQGAEAVAEEIAAYGPPQKVLLAESEALALYTSDAYAKVLADLIGQHQPSVVLFGATLTGKDLSPCVAARLGCGLATDCVGLDLDEQGNLVARRPIYAGKAYVEVVFEGRPQMASVRPNAFPMPAPADQKAPVERVGAEVRSEEVRTVVKEFVKTAGERPELTEADIIVSGGRGMKAAENFRILEELADVLGAAVGASRAAVDAGWRPQSDQVGQTGKTVSPNLYIACGISGAIQHLAGMGTSKYIVAVNKDPEAPIFKKADYGIVEDLFKVVPVLAQEIKKAKA